MIAIVQLWQVTDDFQLLFSEEKISTKSMSESLNSSGSLSELPVEKSASLYYLINLTALEVGPRPTTPLVTVPNRTLLNLRLALLLFALPAFRLEKQVFPDEQLIPV